MPMPGFDDLSIAAWVAMFGVMVVGGLTHGTLGLGFPLITTPLLALFMDVRTAILVTLLPTVSVNVASIVKGGAWGESIGRFWPLAAFSLVGGLAGTRLLIVSDPAPFKLVLAALVVLYLMSSRLGASGMGWVSSHPGWSMLAFGLVAGIAAGTTNVMVPILIIYTLELGLARTAMVQTFNLCFLAGKISQIGMFAISGLIGVGLLLATVPLAAAALLALAGGMVVRERLATETYRRIVRHVLLGLALLLIMQYFLEV